MTADAIVVGAGPNGLAGAVTLAQAGLSVTVLEAAAPIGGGTRRGEVTVPGLLHDHCAAVHPMTVASPYLRTPGLERHGLRWEHAETALAHPLDGGHAVVLQHDLAATVRGLGVDGPARRRLFAPLTAHYDALSEDLMRPLARLPRHPVLTGRFGLLAAQPTQWTLRRWRGQAARALFAGIAAHALQPLAAPGSSAIVCKSGGVTFPPGAGAQLWQPLQHGREHWQRIHFPLRNSVEGVNGFRRDPLHEHFESGGTRRIRGIAAQTLLLAFQLGYANRRKLTAWAAGGPERPPRRWAPPPPSPP
ncbi:NAD(P)-binding protein [Streptomyces sp. NPDC086777]|uniref:phytoene desaturase family protein n=1 Tax=Streptomyces sp. NPDC086777 TaxID=3154866 RepID=UPI0034510309